MPTSQAVWGIEVGQCALKAIRVRIDPESKKIEALAFDYIEHSKILSQPDADPDALSREAIQAFLSRNQVKGDRVVIGVPGQSGLARFIKLPPVEPGRIPEIVKYEARQQIPFALEEVVWDFQTIGKAEETGGFALETEIGLFAMKRDLIFRFLNPFREFGVEVEVVQMRPLAVYNFAAYDQIQDHQGEEEPTGESQREELVEKPAGAAEGGFAVLLDMGADNSDLVITDGTRIWQRNLPIGGNHFTRALTKELKLTFAKAEHLKRNATKAQDPRAIFQAMRPVFNDLVSEIQRSIGYFSSVHRQSKITKIIGMGNAFKLPGLQKFLAQNLQYEVEKVESFKSLKGDQIISAPAFQENILSFTVVYGLALQGLGVSGIRTSLLPPEISQQRMIRRKKPWALSAAAILMAAFTCLFFGNWRQLHAVNSPEFKGPEESAKTAQTLKSTKETAYRTAKDEWTKVKTNGEMLTSNVDKRLEWIEILSIISGALPNNPANVARKNLKNLGEVQITNITATYHDDVKSEWFDLLTKNPNDWPATTLHPLDKSKPPSGPGWVFALEGYHFNELERMFTMYALLDTTNGFQSAAVRECGIQAAMISENWYKREWVPGSDQRTASSRAGRSNRSASAGTTTTTAATTRTGGMMSMLGGMGGGDSPDTASTGTGRQAGTDMPAGFTGGSGGGSFVAAPVTSLPRTDFVLEFVWVPTEKKKRTPVEKWIEELQKAGQPNRKPPEALLKMEQPVEPSPAGVSAPGAPAALGTAPGSPAPPGGTTQGGQPTGQPATPPLPSTAPASGAPGAPPPAGQQPGSPPGR